MILYKFKRYYRCPQEMARVNINILGISELKWTWMGEFNSDDHYIYYFGQESLRRNGVPLTVNKSPKGKYLGAVSKKTEWSLFISKANHSIPQLSKSMPQPLMRRSWSWMVLWWSIIPSRINTKKSVLFIIGDLNAKVWSQEIPGVTGKFGLGVQNEAGQRLTEFCQENTLVIANTLFQQHKRRLYT